MPKTAVKRRRICQHTKRVKTGDGPVVCVDCGRDLDVGARPGPIPSTQFISSRNALLAAALSVDIPTLDALAQRVGVYRPYFSLVANGKKPVSAEMEAKLRSILPDPAKWLS